MAFNISFTNVRFYFLVTFRLKTDAFSLTSFMMKAKIQIIINPCHGIQFTAFPPLSYMFGLTKNLFYFIFRRAESYMPQPCFFNKFY